MNRFISFEGIDGSGKTTQIELLKNKIISVNQKAVCFREPGGTQVSERIREILLSNQNSNLADAAESLLFFASRTQLLHEKILPLSKKGCFIICDRFNDSTIAYQGYGKGNNIKDLNYISNYSINKFMPELTFFLDISVDLSIKRREFKKSDRIESNGVDYLNRVRAGFLDIADKNPSRFIVINGADSEKNVSKQIWSKISDKYKI